jgi:hypothetical protein
LLDKQNMVQQKYDESSTLKGEDLKVGGRFDIGEKYDKNTDVKGMQA